MWCRLAFSPLRAEWTLTAVSPPVHRLDLGGDKAGGLQHWSQRSPWVGYWDLSPKMISMILFITRLHQEEHESEGRGESGRNKQTWPDTAFVYALCSQSPLIGRCPWDMVSVLNDPPLVSGKTGAVGKKKKKKRNYFHQSPFSRSSIEVHYHVQVPKLSHAVNR
jgi:hypothetical protein